MALGSLTEQAASFLDAHRSGLLQDSQVADVDACLLPIEAGLVGFPRVDVDAEDAREYGRRSAREEGLLVGISSGATLAAIAQKLPEIPAGSTVLGFNYDTGERYLSVEGYLPT